MSILLAATGCAVDEDSVGQYLSLPPEIEIVGLESARDRSGMRGPQYFSFLCDGATFSQIVLLNEFESYENFPSQLPTEWKALADIVVKTEKVRSWPEAEVIDRHTVYSDVGRIADQPDNAQLVRFAFHVNDRGYFVVFDAH
jgi:hypothetical protein